MINALFLIVALDFDERDVDVAVGHIDRPAKSTLRLQAEHFLIELQHFIAILRHHRDMPNFRSHFFSLLLLLTARYNFAYSVWLTAYGSIHMP